MSDDAKLLHDFLTAPDGYAAIEAVLRPMVEKALIKHRDAFIGPPELVYKGAGDFLLQHGTFFTRVAEIPEPHRAPRGFCYGSAIAAAGKYGEKYFEGVALAPVCESTRVRESEQGILAMHAWNVHPDRPNLVIDRTWWDAPGAIYCGVEFSVERADDCTWNGDACVLHDNLRGFPLFRQRWNGEPAGLVWPVSERLEIIRKNDRAAGKALIDRMKKQGVWDPNDKTGI